MIMIQFVSPALRKQKSPNRANSRDLLSTFPDWNKDLKRFFECRILRETFEQMVLIIFKNLFLVSHQ